MSGVATNGEEYTPVIAPIKSAAEKKRIVSPPKNVKGTNIKIIVNELFIDRTIVSVSALFAILSNGSVVVLLYSRILSKTIIVS